MTSSKKIISSIIWKYLERSGTQVVQFILSIVLARLLSPADFGLIALVMVFIAIATVFVQSGFNTALIQKKNADALDFSSVFYASLVVAFALYFLLFCCAPLIANFYEMPALSKVVRVLGLTLFFGVFNSIQEAYISRNMLFKKLFYRSLGAIIPSGILGVVLAYLGFGVWALVWQQLFNAFVICVIMWFTVKWRPQLSFSLSRVKSLFSYGWKLLASALLDVGYNNLRNLVIGKMFLPETLGFYSRGSQFPVLIVNNINASIQSVMLPALSSFQDDLNRVMQLTRRAIVTSSFVILPLMAWLAAVAEPLVKVVLGEKWLPCVPFLQICCISYAFWPIHTSNLSAINAVGRSDIFLKLEIIKKILGLMVLVFVIVIYRSPIAIAWSGAVTGLICAVINAHPNKKLLNYGYLEQMRDIFPSLAVSLIMGAFIWLLSFIDLPALLSLILLTFIGFIFYLFITKLLHFECLEYLLTTVRGFRHGK